MTTAAHAGRTRRERGGPWVWMQARVSPSLKDRARRGAAARGVTLSRYMELLIEDDAVADTCTNPGPPEDQLNLSA